MTLQVRVGAEWVNSFHSNYCTQNNLSYRDDHAVGFYNKMGAHGHVKVFCWGNDDAWETDFSHPTHGGDSLNWTDNVHFMFYSDHGGNWSNTMHIAFSSQHRYCLSPSTEWHLGSKMLKWFVMDCCQMVLNRTAAHIGAVWFGPMKGVHLIFGFIGNGTDSWWNDDLGSDFGEDAATGSRLASSWVNHAYSWWLDDDSIAIAAGATEAEAINRRENETVNWRDYNVSSTNWLAWKYRE